MAEIAAAAMNATGQDRQETEDKADDDLKRALHDVLYMTLRINYLIASQQYSPERLWREFFAEAVSRDGSAGRIINMLKRLDYSPTDIFQLLKTAAFSLKQICQIWQEAGMSDAEFVREFYLHLNASKIQPGNAGVLERQKRIMLLARKTDFDAAEFNREFRLNFYPAAANSDSEKAEESRKQIEAEAKRILKAQKQIEAEALHLIMSCGLDDSRLISSLVDAECFVIWHILERLVKLGWNEIRLFRALIDSKKWNPAIYSLLIGPLDNDGNQIRTDWTDDKIIYLMNELSFTDAEKITALRGCGKLLFQVMELMVIADWPLDRFAAAASESGCSPGEIVTAFATFAKQEIKNMAIFRSTDTRDYMAVNAAERDSKIAVINYLEQCCSCDSEIIDILCGQEWLTETIVDYLLAAEWKPEQIIQAMKRCGWSEFRIAKCANDCDNDRRRGGSPLWSDEQAKVWRAVMRKAFKRSDIISAITGGKTAL